MQPQVECTQSILTWLFSSAGFSSPWEKNMRVFNIEVLYFELAVVLREDGRLSSVYFAKERLEQVETFIQGDGER